MKPRFQPLLASAALGLLLSCAAHAEKVTITVSSFPDLDRGVKAAIPGFKKLYPDVEVKLSSMAYPDHHTAMTTALATGANLPDVIGIDMGFIGKFVESGSLEDLSKAPYNAAAQVSRIAKFAVPAATNSKGALAALPVDIGPGALFYRTDLLQKAGVTEAEMTKSWEGFIAAGKKVKASTGAYMLANATDIKDIYIRAGLKDGEGIYFDSKGKSLVASERFERAFDLTRQARQAGIDAKVNAWTTEWSEGFRRDKIAAQMMGAWLSGHLKNWIVPETTGKWRSAQLPAGAFAAYGGSFYAVPAKAANKQAAWDFVQYLTLNKDQQLTAFRNMDAFPSLVEAQTDAFTDQPIEFLAGQKARQLWKTAADRIPALAVDRYDPVAAEIVGAELDKVLEQGKDIKQALADAKSGIERRVRRK